MYPLLSMLGMPILGACAAGQSLLSCRANQASKRWRVTVHRHLRRLLQRKRGVLIRSSLLGPPTVQGSRGWSFVESSAEDGDVEVHIEERSYHSEPPQSDSEESHSDHLSEAPEQSEHTLSEAEEYEQSEHTLSEAEEYEQSEHTLSEAEEHEQSEHALSEAEEHEQSQHALSEGGEDQSQDNEEPRSGNSQQGEEEELAREPGAATEGSSLVEAVGLLVDSLLGPRLESIQAELTALREDRSVRSRLRSLSRRLDRIESTIDKLQGRSDDLRTRAAEQSTHEALAGLHAQTSRLQLEFEMLLASQLGNRLEALALGADRRRSSANADTRHQTLVRITEALSAIQSALLEAA